MDDEQYDKDEEEDKLNAFIGEFIALIRRHGKYPSGMVYSADNRFMVVDLDQEPERRERLLKDMARELYKNTKGLV
jgi:hypothetical protein